MSILTAPCLTRSRVSFTVNISAGINGLAASGVDPDVEIDKATIVKARPRIERIASPEIASVARGNTKAVPDNSSSLEVLF